ncbi:MAG: helix-turn-helix domain-containing protein [Candidatus Acidiferrales bacterium]
MSQRNGPKKLKSHRSFAEPSLGEPDGKALTLSLKLKKVRAFPNPSSAKPVNGSHLFVFYDKSTGTAQLRTETTPSMDHTVERVAGSLAMQCLARGQNPDDFMVLVPAESTLVNQLIMRARMLLDEARVVSGPASLSPRQKEILHSVVSNRANKEIASNLNISVRTVKFHISSLLSKFGVENRNELARRAIGLFRPAAVDDDRAGLREYVREDQRRRDLRPIGFDASDERNVKSRSIRFPGRVMSA